MKDSKAILIMDEEIKPYKVYTTQETQDYLKVSNSTLKRMLKNGILQANKIGGTYRILGKEILRLVSPKAEQMGSDVYQVIKKRVKTTIEKW